MWMAKDPVEHDTAEAVLYACPDLLVSMQSRTTDQLDAKLLCARLAPAIGVEFSQAMRNEHCEAHLTVQRV
jgi:hypothetical protein